MTSTRRLVWLAILAVPGLASLDLALSEQALAHDGGFGHSRRVIYVSAKPGEFVLEYRITWNADEALLEMARMDQDGDGSISPQEKDRYFRATASKLADKIRCTTLQGQMVPLEPSGYGLQQALTQRFQFRVPTKEAELLLTDGVFPHKPGVLEVMTSPQVKAEMKEKVDLTHAERVTLKLSRSASPRI